MSSVPDKPTEEEVREHNVTHSPEKQWRPHCVKGAAKNDPCKAERKEVPDIETDLKATPTISIDLMYLYEKRVRSTLVAADHESGRVWCYALKDKKNIERHRLDTEEASAGHR